MGAVQSFNHLFIRSEFFGYLIVVRKSNYLGNIELELIAKFVEELLGGKWIGIIAIGNEFKVFRQFFQMPESHAHGKDAGANPPVIRYLIANDGTFRCIHDEPDVSLYTTDLDVGFLSSEYFAGTVIVMIDKGLDAHGGRFTVVGNALV